MLDSSTCLPRCGGGGAEKGTSSWRGGGATLEKLALLRGLLRLNTLPPSAAAAGVFGDLPGYPQTGRHEHRSAMRGLQVRHHPASS